MTEPRKPQDHQAKAAAPEKPAGWELLKPFDQVPAWEQAELTALIYPISNMPKNDEGDIDQEKVDKLVLIQLIGALSKKLQDFTVDPEGYRAFVSGSGGLDRASELGMAYVAMLGE